MGLLFTVLVSLVQLIQLIQQDRGIELAVVAGAQSLHGLMDGVLVLVSEQVRVSPAQSMVLIAIWIVSDLSAEMTWSVVRT